MANPHTEIANFAVKEAEVYEASLRVSIAMCTYNGASYVAQQLESFADQTRPPDELVIYDDCSTDDTVEIIRRFARTSKFEVRVNVNEKNIGFARNFANVLSEIHGDIVFCSDQDDVWMPGKIEAFLGKVCITQRAES